MSIALTIPTSPTRRLFLGVERSVCGRAWRDRLDERGAARALAIAQRHDDVPELLARILAGRGVEADEVADLPRSDGAGADARSRPARPTCRRRRRASPMRSGAGKPSRSSATTTSTARPRRRRWRATCASAGSSRSSTSPIACSKATAPTWRRCARSRRRARRCSSPSIAAPPATSRWRRRASSASTWS